MTEVLSAINSKLQVCDRTFPSNAVQRYLVDRLVSFLALGVFKLSNNEIRRVSTIVKEVLEGRAGAFADFHRRLASGWGTNDARQGGIQRIRELVLDRAIRSHLGKDCDSVLDKITATYFLADDPLVRREIVDQVINRLGGQQWSQ